MMLSIGLGKLFWKRQCLFILFVGILLYFGIFAVSWVLYIIVYYLITLLHCIQAFQLRGLFFLLTQNVHICHVSGLRVT